MGVLTGESKTDHFRLGWPRPGVGGARDVSDVGQREREREKAQKELGRRSKRQNIYFKSLLQKDLLSRKGEENFLLCIFPKNSDS